MKRIKRKCINLLLSLLLCLSAIPMMIFSDDSNTVHASTDMTLEEMYNSVAYKAIEYLGYDSQGMLRENGWTFNPNYVGAKLKASSYWSSCRPRYQGKTLDYKEFTGSSSQVIDPADRDTVYAKGGFNCSQTAQYFVFGYLVDQLGYSYPGLANRTAVTINGSVGGFGSVYRLIRTLDDYISRYPDYCMRVLSKEKRNARETLAAFNNDLIPGDIICMWAPDDTYQHVAIYVGKYNGTHYLFHCGVSGRGPELITLDALVGQTLTSSSRSDPETYQTLLELGEIGEPVKAAGSSQNLYTAYRMLQPLGYLKLNKTIGSGSELCEIAGSEFYTLEGAEYTVYTDAACTVVANDKDGNAAVLITDEIGGSNTIALMIGTYYIKETKAPRGFEMDDEVHMVTITASNTESSPALIEVEDDAAFDPFGLTLSKKNSQGTVIAGAQFTLYYYNTDYSSVAEAEEHQPIRTWTFETDETGYFRYADRYKVSGDAIFKDEDGEPCLIDGTYVLKETLTPEHYATADPILMKVTGNTRTLYTADGKTVLSSASTDVAYELNEIALGYLRVYKESSDSEFGETHSVAGAEYTVFADRRCMKVVNIYGTDTAAVMVIAEDNYSNTVELLPGTYYVRETKAADGYKLDDTVYTITVPEYDTVTVNSQDAPQSGYVTVTKSSTDESYLDFHSVAGAVYTVYKDEELTHSVGTLTISDDGVSNAMTLNIGTYYIKETTPAPGYMLDENVYTVTITDDQTVNVDSEEKPANGYLLAVKGIARDSYLVDLASEYYDATGTVINVYTDENCTTQALTFSGETAQLIVGDDGQTTNTVELKAGIYWLREESTTHPFFLSDEVVMVEVKAGDTAETTEAAYDNRPKFDMIKVMLYKLNDKDVPLGNAEFTVRYYSEQISDVDDVGSYSAKASWILKTDNSKGTKGQLIFDEEHKVSGDELWKDADGYYVLLPGTYYFEESGVPYGYAACDSFIINLTMDDIDGVTQKFNAPMVVDKQIIVPDTGDSSALSLYVTIMIFSLFGMAFMLLTERNKRLDSLPE